MSNMYHRTNNALRNKQSVITTLDKRHSTVYWVQLKRTLNRLCTLSYKLLNDYHSVDINYVFFR